MMEPEHKISPEMAVAEADVRPEEAGEFVRGTSLWRDAWRRFTDGTDRFLPAAALAATTAMLTAGLFEYNFGDSEFLMLFLIVVTLPFTLERAANQKSEA